MTESIRNWILTWDTERTLKYLAIALTVALLGTATYFELSTAGVIQ